MVPGKRLKRKLKDLSERRMSDSDQKQGTNQSNSVVFQGRRPAVVFENGYSASEYVRIHAHGRLLAKIELEEVAPAEVMLTPKDLAHRMKPSST